jgi:hypothetical protein
LIFPAAKSKTNGLDNKLNTVVKDKDSTRKTEVHENKFIFYAIRGYSPQMD